MNRALSARPVLPMLSVPGQAALAPHRERHHRRGRAMNGAYDGYRFAVLQDAAALLAHTAAWDELADAAIESNVFHERWMLLPAMQSYGQEADLRIVLAYADQPAQSGRPLLCGLFPFEHARNYKGVPVSHLRLWQYKHCFLGTPLVRADHARTCLSALFGWLGRHQTGAGFVQWEMIATDGPFFAALTDVLQALRRDRFIAHSHTRAVLKPRASAESYLALALRSKVRQDLRRQARQLAQIGSVTHEDMQPGQSPDPWIEAFLELEGRGWKGRRHSALNSTAANRQYFTRMAKAAAGKGRLAMMSLKLDGRPIAMKCNLLATEGGFYFKIAYDEAYARYSPGTLLELRHIEAFHAQSRLQWMDWCSEPDHFMANRLSLDRRTLATCITPTGSAPGRWFVAWLPFLQRCRRRVHAAAAHFRKGELPP